MSSGKSIKLQKVSRRYPGATQQRAARRAALSLSKNLVDKQVSKSMISSNELVLCSLRPQAQIKCGYIFSGGVNVGENTSRPANVRIVHRRCAMRALQRAAAFSNESPAQRVSFEACQKHSFLTRSQKPPIPTGRRFLLITAFPGCTRYCRDRVPRVLLPIYRKTP